MTWLGWSPFLSRCACPRPAFRTPGSDAPGDRWPEVAGLDARDGLMRVAGNRKLYVKLLRQFVAQSALLPAQVAEALAQHDLPLAERLDHTVKGVAGNIGARTVQAVADNLERALGRHAAENDVAPLLREASRTLEDLIGPLRAALGETPPQGQGGPGSGGLPRRSPRPGASPTVASPRLASSPSPSVTSDESVEERPGGMVVKVLGQDAFRLYLSMRSLSLAQRVQGAEKRLNLLLAISIGYDVHGDGVEDLLCRAAQATDGVLAEPSPFVLQKSLDDFYVTYHLGVHTQVPEQALRLVSDLNENIRRAFDEGGVEIMSPHYSSMRDGNRITIPHRYLAASYEAPAFRLETSMKPPEADRAPGSGS